MPKRKLIKKLRVKNYNILRSASLTVFQGSVSRDFSSWCLWKQRVLSYTRLCDFTAYRLLTEDTKTHLLTFDTEVRPGVSSKICKK